MIECGGTPFQVHASKECGWEERKVSVLRPGQEEAQLAAVRSAG